MGNVIKPSVYGVGMVGTKYPTRKNGKTIKERKTIPTYYLYNVAPTLKTDLGRLPKGSCSIRVIAETPYGIRSEYIEKTIEV